MPYRSGPRHREAGNRPVETGVKTGEGVPRRVNSVGGGRSPGVQANISSNIRLDVHSRPG
jgi:hypothetical protein